MKDTSGSRIKNSILIAVIMLVCIVSFMAAGTTQTHAAAEFKETEVIFDDSNDEESYIALLKKKEGRPNLIEKISVADKEIADVRKIGSYNDASAGVEIYPGKPGETTITVKDTDGEKATLTVLVKKSYYKQQLKKAEARLYSDGDLEVSMRGAAPLSIELKIGKKTIKRKGSDGSYYGNINQVLKINSKRTLTLKSYGVTVKKKIKVKKGAATVNSLWHYKNRIEIKGFFSKGDKITVKIGGKKYTGKYNGKKVKVKGVTFGVVTIKKRISNPRNKKCYVTAKDKYNQKIYIEAYGDGAVYYNYNKYRVYSWNAYDDLIFE